MSEIQVINAKDKGFEVFIIAEGGGQGGDKCCLASPLDTIEADEEGGIWVLRLVEMELSQDEGDAVGGFVVMERGLRGGGHGYEIVTNGLYLFCILQ